jgi:phospholipid/cholesterol/gamma-HCH transport system ATP-binding protein
LFDEVHKRLRLTGILVSHEIPTIFSIVQKVAMLHEGTIIAVAPAAEIMASTNPIVHQFMHGATVGPLRYR